MAEHEDAPGNDAEDNRNQASHHEHLGESLDLGTSSRDAIPHWKTTRRSWQLKAVSTGSADHPSSLLPSGSAQDHIDQSRQAVFPRTPLLGHITE